MQDINRYSEEKQLIELGIYLIVGVCAGIIAGLLGAGGGAIIVPPLVWIFTQNGVSDNIIMHLALGTALATIVVTALSSIRAHHSRGAILWSVVKRLTLGIIIGCFMGAAVADALHSATLQIVFGVFLLLLAMQIAFGFKPAPHRALPHFFGITIVGIIVGAASSIVGIGGAALTVPFLLWCNIPMANAVGTSAACGLPLALASTSGYILMGWNEVALPDWSIGYVYLPALLGIAAASMLFAPLGARMAHLLPTAVLKKIFAGVLTLIGLNMLLS